MRLKRTDTHDRLLEFQKQSDNISQGCVDCIQNRPEEYGSHPFYIFAHKREIGTDERLAIYNQDFYESLMNMDYIRKYRTLEDVPTARLIWEPRLTKPKAQENSMLFKSYPGTDNIKIIWMIPAKELWEQFTKDKMTENQTICQSIYDFQHNRGRLEASEDDDLSDDQINAIYTQISLNAQRKKGFIKIL